MKKILLISVIPARLLMTIMLAGGCQFTSYLAFSQYCGSARYDSEVYSTVTTTTDVVYGQNTNINNSTEILKMDVYEPSGDTASKRPVIVLAHGGSFLGGSKTDAELVTLCTRFAKRGYVTCSINYRLGMGFPINQANAQKAVWRATQDMKAAVRFFRKDAATTNTYKADSNFIFVGGYSAGAFMAIHYAYLDQSSEVPSAIDTTTLGGLEGNSGNPGYSSKISGVVNLAGAVGDTSWIKAGDELAVTVQGNNDGTVPYCTAVISVSGFPIMPVSGGGSMHIRFFNLGMENPIHTFYNGSHAAPVSPTLNMDTTVVMASDFLYKRLGCTPTNTAVYANNQTCVPGATGIENLIVINNANISVFPNPSIENVIITLEDARGTHFSAEIFNITGKIVNKFEASSSAFEMKRGDLPSGVYSVKIISNANEIFVAKILFTGK